MGGERMPLDDRLGALTVGSRSLPIGERRAASSSHRVDRRQRRGTLDRMNYRAEWIGGVVVPGTVILLLLVPEFAVIAVLVVALAALVALVALAAAALASPYLLVR